MIYSNAQQYIQYLDENNYKYSIDTSNDNRTIVLESANVSEKTMVQLESSFFRDNRFYNFLVYIPYDFQKFSREDIPSVINDINKQFHWGNLGLINDHTFVYSYETRLSTVDPLNSVIDIMQKCTDDVIDIIEILED